MRAKRSALEFIRDIVNAGERAILHTLGMTLEQFASDLKTRDAVRMCLADIGEAANQSVKLDPILQAEFPDFEAAQAYEMRNVITHGYFGVDPVILWQTVGISVAKIIAQAKAILARRMPK
jgi:uncharacterized protein with HEPN domain